MKNKISTEILKEIGTGTIFAAGRRLFGLGFFDVFGADAEALHGVAVTKDTFIVIGESYVFYFCAFFERAAAFYFQVFNNEHGVADRKYCSVAVANNGTFIRA